MIQTRFGSEVKIVSDEGGGWLKVLRISDSTTKTYHISELKATNGIDEIIDAANVATQKYPDQKEVQMA